MVATTSGNSILNLPSDVNRLTQRVQGRLCAPVTIPEEVVSVVLVEVVPKRPGVQYVRLADSRLRDVPTPGWFCIDLRLLFLGDWQGSLFGHRGCHDLILVVRRRDTIPGIMRPYVLVVRQKPILEIREEEKLEKVCGARPSVTHLEPNGALGFVPGPFPSRTKVDVVATGPSPSVVVGSLIAVECGNPNDRSRHVFRDSILPPPYPAMFGQPLLDASADAWALGTLASPAGEVPWSLEP